MDYTFIKASLFLASVFAVASFFALTDIRGVLKDIRQIDSEIRDANWIMACDDINATDYPQTFNHCN